MPIFAILTILSISLYLFYKVKYFRTKLPMEKKWISSKSSIALGLFVLFFGLNQLITWDTTVAKVVGTIFVIIGALNAFSGYKAYRHYLPYAIDEAEKQYKKS